MFAFARLHATLSRVNLPVCLGTVALSALVSLGGCAAYAGAGSTPASVAVAVSHNAELGTFNKLVQEAGLTSTLEAAGPVTVFAPSDAAFKALPPATLDKLAKDPAALKALLSYHVVPGMLKSADITGATAVTTLNGAKASVSKAGDFVTVDEALVTQADQVTGNGVVHVIDSVLTPPPAKK